MSSSLVQPVSLNEVNLTFGFSEADETQFEPVYAQNVPFDELDPADSDRLSILLPGVAVSPARSSGLNVNDDEHFTPVYAENVPFDEARRTVGVNESDGSQFTPVYAENVPFDEARRTVGVNESDGSQFTPVYTGNVPRQMPALQPPSEVLRNESEAKSEDESDDESDDKSDDESEVDVPRKAAMDWMERLIDEDESQDSDLRF